MDTSDERDFWTVVREHERPPFHFPEEGVNTRLNKAARVVYEQRITPNSDGSFTVEGSAGRTYRCAESCSCPGSQKGKSKWCYHLVATAIYVEWQRRLRPYGAAPAQEDRMTEDPDLYISEPEHAPVAVLEPPTAEPPRVAIPAEYVMAIQGKRHVLYAGLVIGAQRSGLLTLSADWTYNDAELSLAHAVATFADGRRYEDSGDASPSNVNKGIAKHFRRVALTRAKARCLRDALGIQECSVEELAEETPKREVPALPPAPRPTDTVLRQQIWAQVQALAPEVRTRSAVEAWITAETGYPLAPAHYEAIVATLAHLEAR